MILWAVLPLTTDIHSNDFLSSLGDDLHALYLTRKAARYVRDNDRDRGIVRITTVDDREHAPDFLFLTAGPAVFRDGIRMANHMGAATVRFTLYPGDTRVSWSH